MQLQQCYMASESLLFSVEVEANILPVNDEAHREARTHTIQVDGQNALILGVNKSGLDFQDRHSAQNEVDTCQTTAVLASDGDTRDQVRTSADRKQHNRTQRHQPDRTLIILE